jgi:hypothetical protein
MIRAVIISQLLFLVASPAWLAEAAQQETVAKAFAGTDVPSFGQLVQEQRSLLSSIRSDDAALEAFAKVVGPHLGLADLSAMLRAKALPLKLTKELLLEETTEVTRQFMRGLAVWQLAQQVQAAVTSPDKAKLSQLQEKLATEPAWLEAEQNYAQGVQSVKKLSETLASMRAPEAALAKVPPWYADYVGKLDAQSLGDVGLADSWGTLIEEKGPKGLWEHLATSAPQEAVEQERLSGAQQYFNSRIRPLILREAVATAVRLERDAALTVHMNWLRLRSWKDRVRTARGYPRLCGTWHWTVHNHQNHNEQKTLVTFGANGPGPATPNLAEAVILGDAVYLRWEVDGRVQEDSLLFAKEGQRLEGTFVNSLGGWGAVSGKRTGVCRP